MKANKSKYVVVLAIAVVGVLAVWLYFWKANQHEGTSTGQNSITTQQEQSTSNSGLTATEPVPPVPPAEDNTLAGETAFEKNKKKISGDLDIKGFSNFKNRNSLIYTALENGILRLHEVSIDDKSALSEPVLLDETNLDNGKKGFYNITPGTVNDAALYFNDEGGTVVCYNDVSSASRKVVYSVKENESIARILYRKADNELVIVKENSKDMEVSIVTDSINFDREKTIHRFTLRTKNTGPRVTWAELSNDETKLLYCLRDDISDTPVLWVFDFKDKSTRKLTDDKWHIESADWSSNDSKIVFSRKDDKGFSNIFVYDVNLSTVTEITTGSNQNVFPRWSYYRDKILYLSIQNEAGSIYEVVYSNES